MDLCPGTVVKIQHRGLTSSSPHYFVILHVDEGLDEAVLMCVTTSQIEKVRKRVRQINAPRETCVDLSPADCPGLTKACVVDCNEVFCSSVREVLSSRIKMKIGRCTVKKSLMSSEKVKALISGIQASPKIKNKYKKRLL